MQAILVVDDAADIRETLRGVLEKSGYRVIEAGDGKAGIAAYKAHRPALVLTDLNMPGAHGIAVAAELLSFDPQARIIVMTGSGGLPADLPDALRQRLGWIAKPFRRATLVETVAQALASA